MRPKTDDAIEVYFGLRDYLTELTVILDPGVQQVLELEARAVLLV